MPQNPHPYEALTPDVVIDCVERSGLISDARIFPLNSYENRVYQVGIEDNEPLIAKFYRPGRWSDAQILEEHQFTLELAAAEIPVVAPLQFDGHTLLEFAGFRFALFPRRGGASWNWTTSITWCRWGPCSGASMRPAVQSHLSIAPP